MPKELTTERVRTHWERFAPRYDRSIRFWERVLKIPEGRRWVASQAIGDVLEIGVGAGLNLPLYGQDVRLTAVDLSPAMLAQARRRASDLGREIDLREGDAQALDFPEGRFDTVVFSLCLCSIPDDRRAVAEGVRVLRPGGRMLLLEHVRSPSPIVSTGPRLIEVGRLLLSRVSDYRSGGAAPLHPPPVYFVPWSPFSPSTNVASRIRLNANDAN